MAKILLESRAFAKEDLHTISTSSLMPADACPQSGRRLQRLLTLRYVEGNTVHEDCADEKEILAELQQV